MAAGDNSGHPAIIELFVFILLLMREDLHLNGVLFRVDAGICTYMAITIIYILYSCLAEALNYFYYENIIK